MEVRFNRRVNISFIQQLGDDEPEMTGDLMVPEPDLASNLVHALLMDWTIKSVSITAENSVEEDGEGN